MCRAWQALFCSVGSGDLSSGPHACSADASPPQEAILSVLQNSPLPDKRQARLHTKPTREQFCKLLTCDHQERHRVLWVIVRSAEAWGLLVRWPSYPSTHGLTSATPMEELRRLDAHCAPDSSCRLQASVLRWMSLNYPLCLSLRSWRLSSKAVFLAAVCHDLLLTTSLFVL